MATSNESNNSRQIEIDWDGPAFSNIVTLDDHPSVPKSKDPMDLYDELKTYTSPQLILALNAFKNRSETRTEVVELAEKLRQYNPSDFIKVLILRGETDENRGETAKAISETHYYAKRYSNERRNNFRGRGSFQHRPPYQSREPYQSRNNGFDSRPMRYQMNDNRFPREYNTSRGNYQSERQPRPRGRGGYRDDRTERVYREFDRHDETPN